MTQDKPDSAAPQDGDADKKATDAPTASTAWWGPTRAGMSSSIGLFIRGNGDTFPLDLEGSGKTLGHTLIIGDQSGQNTAMTQQSFVKLATELNGRDFAMLDALELNRFRLLRDAGRKLGFSVAVEVIHDSEDIQAALAAASPAGQEEIYRSLATEIVVRSFVVDK